ncbi:MAG: hypothetical protein AMXMBFR58_18070 [Phycisphaerae bacterium]
MERSEEQRLIRKAAKGNRAAIEALVRAHQSSLYGFIVRLTGRPEIAEDVVQEAFVRVILNIHRFDSRFRFSTWLFTIARRLYLNAAQRSAPGFDTDAVERRMTTDDGPTLRLAQAENTLRRRDLVNRALAVLSVEQREIVLLFHQHQWPIRAIAEHVQIPEGTVKSHLHRARRALRDALGSMNEDDAFFPPGGESSMESGRSHPARGADASAPDRSTQWAGENPGDRATLSPGREQRAFVRTRLIRTEVQP